MAKEKKRVMEKLVAQCRQAFQAKKPLIMVDTEEIEVMERLAREIKTVPLFQHYVEEYRSYNDPHYIDYYEYIGTREDPLRECSNFSYQTGDLQELCARGTTQDYTGVAQMRVVHLKTEDHDTRQHLKNLRSYVHSYVRCMDDQCALRSSCILLYGNPEALAKDLLAYTEIFSVDYPQRWEIQEILCQIARENKTPLEPLTAKSVAELMVGFTLVQVEEYTRRLFRLDGKNGKPLMFDAESRETIILDAKAQAIRRTGDLLTLYRETKKKDRMANDGSTQENTLGGMRKYKQWVGSAGIHMKNNDKYTLDLGSSALKGVLLCGVPGCGKSEAAKILHREWGLPMLRMDVDNLMGGLVGDSERNMRQALSLVEAMAPCILWIDEIEKGFSGASTGDGDGGTFKRMFGRLLTWMQENKKPCFIFATANDISHLPPEFFRSGRFDALFSVYMPTNQECMEIFREQMRRAEGLRQKTAGEWGITEKRSPLFEEDCFKDTTLQAIMNIFTQGKDPKDPAGVKFVSGADIAKITAKAIQQLAEKELYKLPEAAWTDSIEEAEWQGMIERLCPIKATTWTEVLTEVIEDPSMTTQGSGSASLDQIAACYVRMMRGNFAPVSAEDQQLFRKEHYTCTTDGSGLRASYTGKCEMDKPYDQALYHALKPRIESIGKEVEIWALRRLGE